MSTIKINSVNIPREKYSSTLQSRVKRFVHHPGFLGFVSAVALTATIGAEAKIVKQMVPEKEATTYTLEQEIEKKNQQETSIALENITIDNAGLEEDFYYEFLDQLKEQGISYDVFSSSIPVTSDETILSFSKGSSKDVSFYAPLNHTGNDDNLMASFLVGAKSLHFSVENPHLGRLVAGTKEKTRIEEKTPSGTKLSIQLGTEMTPKDAASMVAEGLVRYEKQKAEQPNARLYHAIAINETLNEIATNYQTSTFSLAEINGIINTERLMEGDVLQVKNFTTEALTSITPLKVQSNLTKNTL